jgi:hypothetical protein
MLWLKVRRGGTGEEEGGGAGEEEAEEGLEPSYIELEGFIRFSFWRLLQNQTRTTSCHMRKPLAKVLYKEISTKITQPLRQKNAFLPLRPSS